jgi:predicted dehydrogenase
MRTIRWGIIGVGDVTEVKSGPGFYKARNSALVAVMRRNGDLAKDYAQRHNVPRWYDDADALINDPEVDVVYIATPPYAHKDYTLKAARAGKPVYVEKPMAMNFAECQTMVEACKEAGVPLWVAYYRRMMPRFLKIKELVDTGAIGEVRSVTTTLYQPPREDEMDANNLPWRVLPEYAGGGKFVDLSVHTLNFLDYVFGAIRGVRGFATNQAKLYPAEDQVVGTFMYESGVVGTGVWCFNSARSIDQNTITGTKGTLTFSTFATEPPVLTTENGTQEIPVEHPAHVHQPLIQTIVVELNGQGKCPSTGESGARTTWVTDQLLREYYDKQSSHSG